MCMDTQESQNQTVCFYGLPNAAARGYFLCKQFLNREQNVVFARNAQTDEDTLHAAIKEFGPQNARAIHLPQQHIGRMAALYQLLQTNTPFVLDLHAEDLDAQFPSVK